MLNSGGLPSFYDARILSLRCQCMCCWKLSHRLLWGPGSQDCLLALYACFHLVDDNGPDGRCKLQELRLAGCQLQTKTSSDVCPCRLAEDCGQTLPCSTYAFWDPRASYDCHQHSGSFLLGAADRRAPTPILPALPYHLPTIQSCAVSARASCPTGDNRLPCRGLQHAALLPVARTAGLLPLPTYTATRVGEATNPGPQADIRQFFAQAALDTSVPDLASPKLTPTPMVDDSAQPLPPETDSFVVAVVNPTAVNGKAHVLAQLGAQVIFLSETSAVQQVQDNTGKELKSREFHTVWGMPVDAHVSQKTGQPTLRGFAAGVAVASCLPLARAPVPLAPDAAATQRVVEGVLRLGDIQLRVISWYGFPSCHVDAKERNDKLLRMVLDRVALSRVPTLIGGDANVRVQDLPAWQHFQYLGYQEYFEFHSRRFGQQLPPTCKQATRHDSLLVPPLLQGMVVSARVDTQTKLFDSHDPLLVTFTKQPSAPLHVWRMPRPWTDFHPDMERACEIYSVKHASIRDNIVSCQTPEQVSGAFAQWAQALEQSVDEAIRAEHAADPVVQPHKGLPRAARGRCVWRDRSPLLHAHVPRGARHGDYNPDSEAVSVKARRMVRQVRRVQSLLQCLQARGRRSPGEPLQPALQSQLLREWRAIQKDKAFGPRFDSWILGFPNFGHCWVDIPPCDWLHDVLQLAKHVCDSHLRHEAAVRSQRFRYLVQLDCDQNGQKLGFAGLRPRPRPPIGNLPVTESRQATRVGSSTSGSVLYEVNHPRFLWLHSPVTTDVGVATVDAILPETQGDRPDMVRLNFHDVPAPPHCQLHQPTQAVTTDELHREFVNYWVDIWWRDSPCSAQVDKWPGFLAELPPRPPEAVPVQARMRDISLWERALKLRPHKATGYDGFSPAELKGLRGRPLADLVELFHVAITAGFPKHLARAKVYTLAKIDEPKSFADGRPITIFATIYRLWASILSKEILGVWSSWMSSEVAGSMPGRSCSDVAYSLQTAIEQAVLSGSPLGGFSLDITKCFNMIPRAPAAHLMQYLGVPEPLVQFWQQILEVSEKSPVLAGGIGSSMGATTGVPEGDALSVVAMASVCWFITVKNRATHAKMHTYVDNFSWVASCKQELRSSLCLAQRLCATLCLPIDWKKSFSWATSPTLKQFWDREAKALLPEGVSLHRVRDARDLGVHFQFQSRKSCSQADKRLEEGRQRLDRLRKQPRPLFHKVRLLVSGIWPQTFYGREGRILPRATVEHFRSKAAKALCHTGPSQSAILLLSAMGRAPADPEVFLFIQAATALRRAFHVQPELAAEVLRTAVEAGVDAVSVGPATTFAAMCARLGWEMQTTGWCCGPGLHTFSVRCSSRRQISTAIQAAWGHEVAVRVSHRNGLHALGSVSGPDTFRVLASLPAKSLRTAVNCLAGGHMSASAQSLWDPCVEPNCKFCGDRDTKFHRVFVCPFYAEVRNAFQPMLQWVEQNAMHWIHSACVTDHPDHEVLRLLFRTRPHVAPNPLQNPCVPGLRVLYTDGSCTVPNNPQARHAAWAIVEDRGLHIPTVLLLDHFRVNGKALPCFHVVSQGLVPREQTIGRAEVIAVLQAFQLALREPHVQFQVFVDSTYALAFIDQLQERLQGRPGPRTDLDLCEWIEIWHRPLNVSCRKVKSHAPCETVRHSLGNAMADLAAKEARQADAPIVYSRLEELEKRQSLHQDMLRGYFQFQLQCAQLVGSSRTATADGAAFFAGAPLETDRRLQAWSKLRPAFTMYTVWPDLCHDWLLAAPWPPWYTSRVWKWATALQWPAMPAGPVEPFNSIALLELLADFVVTTGACPPLAGPPGTGTTIPIQSAEGKLLPTAVKDLVITLAASLKFLESVSKTSLLLGTAHRKVASMQSLGCHAPRRGVVPRPALVSPETVLLQVLDSAHPIDALRYHASQIPMDEFGLTSALHSRWKLLTSHQREGLRRRLRS